MPSAKLTPGARQDLKEIAKYIGRVNRRPITAEEVIRAIKSKCAYYSENPLAAQSAPDLGPNLRLGIHQRWVIIYEPIDTGIRVLRIVDGARDYSRLYQPIESRLFLPHHRRMQLSLSRFGGLLGAGEQVDSIDQLAVNFSEAVDGVLLDGHHDRQPQAAVVGRE